jgi:hypothetical protein
MQVAVVVGLMVALLELAELAVVVLELLVAVELLLLAQLIVVAVVAVVEVM